jgi:Ni,Fe-hydrogenase maturation factor
VIGVEPEDIRQFDLELSPSVAARVPDLIDRVLTELRTLGVNPEKKV